jgi:hypothetical protein
MQFEKMNQVYEQSLPALGRLKKELGGFLEQGAEAG